jgi:Fe-S oxidoreductase
MISIKSRDLAYEHYPVFRRAGANGGVDVVGDPVTPAELWACTTCGACEEACPVLIEYVDKIVDMRRFLVEEGDVPAGLQKAMADLERRGNPYGKPGRLRGDWIKGIEDDLRQSGSVEASRGPAAVEPEAKPGQSRTIKEPVRILKKGEEAGTLFFTDSCAAYDPRIQDITRATARLLASAGTDLGTLGKDEADSGHEARRLGEEGLFEALRDQNLLAMEARSYDRVVTTDPHALNALRHDGYDLEQPVVHHTRAIADLVRDGTMTLKPLEDGRTYTFHDPCYLGRHNGEYDAPRELLDAIPGLKRVEMERSRNRSFCCGGGSLYLFYEGESESRMGEQRIAQAADVGAGVIVTACPFCLINLEDAAKVTGRDIQVMDIAEVVERAVNDER